MNSQGLIDLMDQVEEKGMDWDTVTEKIKIPYQVLSLYRNSGPVPATIEKNLKKLLEEPEA
ncbi:MAG: hypothetical protein GY846_08930 [Deltaproteobacteria bacterium]|nr:hypothetical protein [Deltaproteobacteria bacterium]